MAYRRIFRKIVAIPCDYSDHPTTDATVAVCPSTPELNRLKPPNSGTPEKISPETQRYVTNGRSPQILRKSEPPKAARTLFEEPPATPPTTSNAAADQSSTISELKEKIRRYHHLQFLLVLFISAGGKSNDILLKTSLKKATLENKGLPAQTQTQAAKLQVRLTEITSSLQLQTNYMEKLLRQLPREMNQKLQDALDQQLKETIEKTNQTLKQAEEWLTTSRAFLQEISSFKVYLLLFIQLMKMNESQCEMHIQGIFTIYRELNSTLKEWYESSQCWLQAEQRRTQELVDKLTCLRPLLPCLNQYGFFITNSGIFSRIETHQGKHLVSGWPGYNGVRGTQFESSVSIKNDQLLRIAWETIDPRLVAAHPKSGYWYVDCSGVTVDTGKACSLITIQWATNPDGTASFHAYPCATTPKTQIDATLSKAAVKQALQVRG